jgi:hypothetical protein
MNFEAKNTRVEQVGDATVLCEQHLKDQRARVQAAAKAAEFSPGSLAGGSLTEQRNMTHARLQECWRLGGWLPGAIGFSLKSA